MEMTERTDLHGSGDRPGIFSRMGAEFGIGRKRCCGPGDKEVGKAAGLGYRIEPFDVKTKPAPWPRG